MRQEFRDHIRRAYEARTPIKTIIADLMERGALGNPMAGQLVHDYIIDKITAEGEIDPVHVAAQLRALRASAPRQARQEWDCVIHCLEDM